MNRISLKSSKGRVVIKVKIVTRGTVPAKTTVILASSSSASSDAESLVVSSPEHQSNLVAGDIRRDCDNEQHRHPAKCRVARGNSHPVVSFGGGTEDLSSIFLCDYMFSMLRVLTFCRGSPTAY